MNTQAYFEDLHEIIQQEILAADHTIYGCVNWFSSPSIFEALFQQSKKGVKIHLALQDHEINLHHGNFELLKLNKYNAQIHQLNVNQSSLPFFLVVDKRTIVSGDFEWINEQTQENPTFTITHDAPEYAKEYLNSFVALVEKYCPNYTFNPTTIDFQALIKRLDILRKTINLEDEEDIDYQTNKLKRLINGVDKTELIVKVEQLINVISNKSYAESIELVNQLLMTISSLTTWKDPEIDALQLEVKSLSVQLSSLEDEKAELEKDIKNFHFEHNKALGDIILNILEAEIKVSKRIYEQDPQNEEKEQAFKRAKSEYEDYFSSSSKTKAERKFELTEDELKEIKHLYRRASKKCHPDLVDDEMIDQAKSIFEELTKAYQLNDLEHVRKIYAYLNGGNSFSKKYENIQKKNLLKTEIQQLKTKVDKIVTAILYIKNSTAYQIILKHQKDWTAYFDQQKITLERYLKQLQENG